MSKGTGKETALRQAELLVLWQKHAEQSVSPCFNHQQMFLLQPCL